MTNKLGNSKNKRKRRAWPDKRRRQQSEINRKTRPWEKSTGPKTDRGKAEVSQNALKHGWRSQEITYLRAVLKRQRDFVKLLLATENARTEPEKRG